MTIEELNKLIKEELSAFLEAEDDDVDAGDDIEVTTDEPAVEDGDEALDTLRQIFNMLKPLVEPEEEEVEDLEGEETEDEEIADGEDDDEGLDEGVLNETHMRLFEFMEEADILNKAVSDPVALKLLGGTIASFAALFGYEATKDKLSDAVKKLAQKGVDIAKQALTKPSLLTKLDTIDNEGEDAVDSAEKPANEAVDNHTFFRGDNANRVRPEAKDVQGRREKVNESVEKITEKTSNDFTDRFQKLANIQK